MNFSFIINETRSKGNRPTPPKFNTKINIGWFLFYKGKILPVLLSEKNYLTACQLPGLMRFRFNDPDFVFAKKRRQRNFLKTVCHPFFLSFFLFSISSQRSRHGCQKGICFSLGISKIPRAFPLNFSGAGHFSICCARDSR